MFPFWDLAIAPIIEAVGARRVVEIGALRGETTELMLDRLGPDVELHVIDPVPDFDPSEHEVKFPGRYVFHRDLSVNVLRDLPAVDVALIDGDHNWYTVYNELRLLAGAAERAGRPLPVMIMHDVGWPYGRRDLYYDPENIPEQYRLEHAEKGLIRGNAGVSDKTGVNPKMHNATVEGGPRNGVMTGLDDFLEEYGRPVRRVLLPIYFGLAIVVDTEVLEAHPALGERLDWLEGAEGRGELLELSESIRLQALTAHHNLFYRPNPAVKANRRYLDLLKGALLDEHYMENEVRIDHLVRHLLADSHPTENAVRDPVRQMKDKTRQMLAARRAGKLDADRGDILGYFPYSTMGRVRLDHLERCLDNVREERIAGDLVECGTGRGGGGIFLRGYTAAWEMNDRRVWIADTFRAAPAFPEDMHESTESALELLGGGPGLPNLRADLNTVRDAFKRFDLFDNRLRFLQGQYADTLPGSSIGSIALLRLGDDLDDTCGEILDLLYDRVSPGGYIVIEDFLSPAAQKSIEVFRARRGIDDPIEQIDWSGAFWRKGPDTTPVTEPSPVSAATARGHAPLAKPAPKRPKDLSVVVVFYNMRREAERTLHALSRAYQEGIDDLDYEVIAVENGSAADQRLGKDFVQSFGPEFRYIDMGKEATSSPVPALNRGVAEAKGEAIALMIDGAHIVTPGVLRYGMTGLRAYGHAIVATQQWFVGPGQQGDVMVDGYDQDVRGSPLRGDPLAAGRLPTVRHRPLHRRPRLARRAVGEQLPVRPRSLLEQVGAFDESFNMPGAASPTSSCTSDSDRRPT